jgi:hypothetical protein
MSRPRANVVAGVNASAGELLAERKALLLARSSLYRLALAHEADLLRQSFTLRNLASSATGAGALKPLIFGALLLVAGRSRIARLLGLATRVIAVVKMVQAVRGAARRKAP